MTALHLRCWPLRGPPRASPSTWDFLESGLSPSPQIPFPPPPGTPATSRSPSQGHFLTLCCHATRWDWPGARSVPWALGLDRASLPARLCATCRQGRARAGTLVDPSTRVLRSPLTQLPGSAPAIMSPRPLATPALRWRRHFPLSSAPRDCSFLGRLEAAVNTEQRNWALGQLQGTGRS